MTVTGPLLDPVLGPWPAEVGMWGSPPWLASVVAQANDVVLVAEAEPVDAASGGPRVVYVNPAFTRMTGYAAEEILGLTPRILQSPKTDQVELDRVRAALARWEPVEVELLNVHKDGTEFWVQINISPVADERGWFTHWVAIQRDITARRSRESALAAMLASTSDLMLVLDGSGVVTDASPSALRILGTEPDMLLGSLVLDLVHPEERGLMAGLLAPTGVLRLGRAATAELRCRQQDGGWRWLEVSAADLTPDSSPAVVLACADVTVHRAAQAQLRHQALHDALTGLPNRALLLDRLTQVLAGGHGTTAVLFCDLDRFKMVNDSLGHHAGDLVLTTVAARLLSAVRPQDTVARLAGDEFVVLCPNTTAAAAVATATRLQQVLGAPFPVLGTELTVAAAIGVATATTACTAESLLRDADAAMYAAKEAGPGRVEVFDTALGVRTYSRLQRVTELAAAISTGQLRLHYQPVLTLPDRVPVGREALVRWEHPTRGLLAPGEFISLAEDAGLVYELGAWVLEAAVADAARRIAAGAPAPRTWVNVSAHELTHPDFLPAVRTTLARHQVPGEVMGVEITESVLMADVDHAHRTLSALRELGMGVAVDDFGTGYSSLSYLARFPVDIVKIDATFVAGVSDPHRRRESFAVISAVISLAHTLDLQVVAEGIETTAQAETLHGLGCDHGQGFLLGRPTPS
jgi:diguanylate cyclase (GGDEF)-like protein/PAS domain S-box-containing protein